MTQSVDVEIYADIICPWCYIGKKRLDAAFAARPHVTPRYIWRCFLLNPTMPSTGMDRQAYLIGKFGNAAKAVYGHIADAGLESDIAFNFELSVSVIIATPVNSSTFKLCSFLKSSLTFAFTVTHSLLFFLVVERT